MKIPNQSPRSSLLGLGLARKLLNAAQRRFRRARSGSVLILVVALLVLLALIGTAFITTAGNDREAATQHKYNTQIDMLVQGVQDLVVDAYLHKVRPADAVTNRSLYRPAPPHYAPDMYTPPLLNQVSKEHGDFDTLVWDAILADRYPAGVKPTMTSQATSARWRYISASPLAINRDPNNCDIFPNQFRSPFVSSTDVEFYSSRFQVEPTHIPVTLPNGQTRKYPAFYILDPNDPNTGKRAMAADADGDGIADSGLFELSSFQIDGVRYFGAIRVIDNSAAVNASIAWEPWQAANGADLQGNFTPANIALRMMLEGPANNGPESSGNFLQFQTYRQGGQAQASLTPVRDDGGAPHFRWATHYDAFYFGLGQRLDRPGKNGAVPYTALGLRESANMAYRFTLANPLGSNSAMEQFFPTAAKYLPAINRQPYQPDQVADWYNGIFNTDYIAATTPQFQPIRPFVTAYNPVTNNAPAFLWNPSGELTTQQIPVSDIPAEMAGALPAVTGVNDEVQRNGRYRYRGNFSDNPITMIYRIGDWVRHNGKSYVAICNSQGIAPDANTVADPRVHGSRNWAEAPWMNQPVKLNPNTANFGTLMAAYWGVMADGPMVKPPGNLDDGYGGDNIWTFGDVIRPNPTAQPLKPYYMKQLRAAIAAVNTIDLRDQDEDITSRTVTLTDINGLNPVIATVYGSEKQPFITEVMVHITRDDVPYVAIELYNPHPVPVDLAGFKLFYRDRDTGGAPVEIPTDTIFPTRSIPGLSYLLIESAQARRPTTNPGKYPTLGIVALAGLDVLVQGSGERELLIMRTRRYDGNFSTSTEAANNFQEVISGAANGSDLVPIDQLEFQGIIAGESNRLQDPADITMEIPIADRYHYRRANSGPNCNRWHVVYSGPYQRGATGDERRQRGFVRDKRPDVLEPMDEKGLTAPGWTFKVPDLGVIPHNGYDKNPPDPGVPPESVQLSTYRTRTLQLANTGMAGPWGGIVNANAGFRHPISMPPGPDMAFPFGGFARTGDLLQVTFVGGYKIESTGFSEINSVTIDASFAEDGDREDDDDTGGSGASQSFEQLGRFCPLYKDAGGNVIYNDFYGRANPARPIAPISPPPARTADAAAPAYYAVPARGHKYAWAADLFDYFNVFSPQDDYLPNVDPDPAGDPTVVGIRPPTQKFPGGETIAVGQNPQPIPNRLNSNLAALKAGAREDTAANHGLINLNTASEYVMAQIPFTNNPAANQDIAFAIAYYRTTVGPLRSIFDLQRIVIPNPQPAAVYTPNVLVKGTRIADAFADTSVFDPNQADGDISPYPANFSTTVDGVDGVAGDFESRYLVMNRVSNMVCFRSDSSTAYILVQGWRNAGTKLPELVAQRRIAVIIDRSTVAPRLPTAAAPTADIEVTAPTITNVPQN